MPSGNHIPEEVVEDLLELICDALAARMYKGQIKTLVRSAFPKESQPCTVTIERLITKAKERMLETTGTDRQTARKQAVDFYESVIRDYSVPMKDRLKAQERLDKILGIEFNGRTEDTADETAKRIRDTLREQAQAYD